MASRCQQDKRPINFPSIQCVQQVYEQEEGHYERPAHSTGLLLADSDEDDDTKRDKSASNILVST